MLSDAVARGFARKMIESETPIRAANTAESHGQIPSSMSTANGTIKKSRRSTMYMNQAERGLLTRPSLPGPSETLHAPLDTR